MNPTGPKLPFATSHAFIIGINAYEHVSALKTAVNDAKGIAERLESQHGYTVHEPLLDATYGEIKKLLKETLPKVVGDNDRVLFYFAGHGIALDGEDGPNGYLVAADTKPGEEGTFIPMNDLHDALTALPCRHGLLILDCCFSGAFKWTSGFRDVVFDLPKIIYQERFWRYCKDPAWQVITSAAHDQKAVDIITHQSLGLRESSGTTHSPFATALFKALEGEADVIPAGAGDGVITATELYSYLRDWVETETTEKVKRQSPSLFQLKRHDKGEFIFLSPNHRFNLPPTPDRNPFMGLSSYNEEDTHLFYGRDRVVEALMERVKNHPMVVVSGASGTGKSSVIKAGVLPQLRKLGYEILPIIRPGKEPVKTLEVELPEADRNFVEKKAVLVIDQYEELITQCLHQEERVKFETKIAEWLNSYPDLRILLSIRSDFEPQFETEVLATWWQFGRYVVPAFSLEEIREVITQPASQSVLFYEPEELVEQLSEEVSQAPGALPLLSFTLSELYHAYLRSGRQDRALTEEDYTQLGGVVGALRTRADAEYTSLDPEGQSSMRKLMLRMVSLEGGELAGKRVYAEELIFREEAETKRLETIAGRLVGARLLLRGKDGLGRIYVEPAHDALVRAWARLWEWIKASGEEKIALQYKLSLAVNDYHDLVELEPKKARKLLWNNNPRLDLLKVELEAKDQVLNSQEERFVRRSVNLRKAKRRQLIGSLSTAMVVFAVLALLAWIQTGEAREQRNQAEARSLAFQSNSYLESDPTIALRLGEAAYRKNPNSTVVLQALSKAYYEPLMEKKLFYQQLVRHNDIINHAVFSRSGDRFLTASDDKWARVWDLEGNCVDSLLHPNIVTHAAFSPDGKYISTISYDSCYVWKFREGLLTKWKAQRLKGNHVSFSPNGKTLLTASSDSTAILWDINPEKVGLENLPGKLVTLYGHMEVIMCAAFSSNGQEILTGSADNSIRIWKADGTLMRSFELHTDNVFSVAFSSDGERILSASKDGNVNIFLKNGQVIKSLQQAGAVNFAAFSSDNGRVAIAKEDGIAKVYTDKGNHLFDLSGHSARVESICFSPDGKWVLTASADHTARLWQTGIDIYESMVTTFTMPKTTGMGMSKSIKFGAFSPDGNRILLAKDNGQIILWAIDKSDSVLLEKEPGYNNAIGFSADGEAFLTGTGKTIQIWDKKGKERKTFDAHAQEIKAAMWAVNKNIFLTASQNELCLWNSSGEPLQIIKDKGNIQDAVFTPKKSNILLLTKDHQVQFWGQNGKLIKKIQVAEGEGFDIAISHDEKEILFRMENNEALCLPLNGGEVLHLSPGADLYDVQFSPDPSSQFILTASRDGKAILWDKNENPLVVFDHEKFNHGGSSAVISATFSPNGNQVLTTTNNGKAILWDTPKGIIQKLQTLPLYQLEDEKRFQ